MTFFRRAALTIAELTAHAIADLAKAGYAVTDPAGPAVAKVFGPRLQQHGDTEVIASYVGVPTATLYQWVHRYRDGGVRVAVQVAARRRNAAHRREMAQARRNKLAHDAAVIAAWNEGISSTIATGVDEPRDGSSRISELRKKYGVEKVPYRRPDHWRVK